MRFDEEFWVSRLSEKWFRLLEPLLSSENMNQRMKILSTEYSEYQVFPQKKDIFKVFRLIEPDDVKAVVLGQDPYPTQTIQGVPFATGVAFANSADVDGISPSLMVIRDRVLESGLEWDQTLSNWIDNGVLPINTSFTVRARQPDSHRLLWADFTKHLISSLKPLEWHLWGTRARDYEPFIKEGEIYTCEHPSYAGRMKRPWNNRYIDRLYSLKETEINK